MNTVEMEGEVEFRRDAKTNLIRAVSDTEWLYRRGALERSRRVSVIVCVVHQGCFMENNVVGSLPAVRLIFCLSVISLHL